MNSISTKLVKLDLKTILANYNKPQFWEKSWRITDRISFRLNSINIKSNEIIGEFYFSNEYQKVRYGNTYHTHTIYNWNCENIIIPIRHSDYTESKFKSDIISKCLKLINTLECKCIMSYAEYKEAESAENQYKDYIVEKAENLLDEEGVYNDDIREAYIDSVIANNEIPDYTTEVLKKFEYTIIPYVYLSTIAFIGDEEDYEKISNKCNKVRKSTRIKIWLDKQKIEKDEMEVYLPEI